MLIKATKQLLDEAFVIYGIIKIEVSFIADITKTESNNCFIIQCFKGNNDKRTVEDANRRDMFLLRCVQDATYHL